MARIVVTGYMIRHPVAGNLYAYFHYVLGLHRLGHEVLYLEESGWPNSCFDPVACEMTDRPDAGLRALRGLFARHGLETPVAYVDRDQGTVHGLGREELSRHLASADLLLNVGGVCWLPEFLLCRRRALIDMDPLFTQLGMFGAEGRDHYHVHFSYGVNIGRPECTIPRADVDWVPTVPPVVVDIWSAPATGREPAVSNGAFTTIANWSAYGGITHEGEHYGQKDEEFLRLLELPGLTDQPLELALSGAGTEIEDRLRGHGWRVRPADTVSTRVGTYTAYIAGSRGEFSAAKNAYVKTRSGWFSDRSVSYLAAGRPVVLQQTGFDAWLPTGTGVLGFSGLEEAAACLLAVDEDYETHRRGAREVAETVFSHEVVLPPLVARALGGGA